MQGKRYSYFLNSDRTHGFTLDPAILRGYLVIAVDFDIPIDVMQHLVNENIAVICLDHHRVQNDFIDCINNETGAEGIVINNQYPFEPSDDRYQSGAGVVYEALSSCFPAFKSREREAIVGITLLSDARPIESKKARQYLKTTYSYDSNSGYIGYLIQSVLQNDYSFGVPRMDRNFIDYTFSPRINALLRYGKETEAIDFIFGRGISSATAKLKQEQTNLISLMKQKANILELTSVTIIAVNSDDFSDKSVNISNFIGLCCNNIKNSDKSVLGFVFKNGKVVRASFRGRYDNLDYLSAIRGLGIQAEGHPPAFGIINFNPTKELWLEIDKVVGEVDNSHKSTVTIYDVNNLSIFLMQRGMNIANENCYVRDMFRSYIHYTGSNIKEIAHTYKSEPFSPDDYAQGIEPDYVVKGEKFKYVRDSEGNKVTKFIEYLIDGKKVKSFGVDISDGYILPILERGYIQLYIKSRVS